MAGTIRGRIEAFTDEGALGNDEGAMSQVFFKNLYDVLNAHPNTTLVALQYGSGTYTGFTTGSGGGTDYYDGAAPFEANAFAVFRMETTAQRSFPYYILIQWAAFNDLGQVPGDPASDRGGGSGNDAYVGIAFAVGEGGDENPWNGTTNADGTDTKGDPVWTVPGGGDRVHVWPRENNPGGTGEDTQKKLLYDLLDWNVVGPLRQQIVMDDDNIWLAHDQNDNNDWEVTYFGLYSPRPELSPTYPICLMGEEDIPFQEDGSISDFTREFSVLHPADTAQGVRYFRFSRIPELFTSTRQPNDVLSPVQFDEVGFHVFGNEGYFKGYFGVIDDMREIYGVASGDTNAALTVAFFGTTTTDSEKAVFPWDGATTPGTGATRSGVDFTRTP